MLCHVRVIESRGKDERSLSHMQGMLSSSIHQQAPTDLSLWIARHPLSVIHVPKLHHPLTSFQYEPNKLQTSARKRPTTAHKRNYSTVLPRRYVIVFHAVASFTVWIPSSNTQQPTNQPTNQPTKQPQQWAGGIPEGITIDILSAHI